MSIPSSQPLNRFVRAGAGAGKTWNLTRQVVQQAMDHRERTGQWPKTILTTFTRKATQELKERLMLYSLQERPEAIEFVQSTSFLTITTIHGLFSLFLKRYGTELGLPNQFKIINGRKAEFWRKQVLKNLLSENQNFKTLQNFGIQRLLKYLKAYEKVYWERGVDAVQLSTLQALTNEYTSVLAQELSTHVTAAETDIDCEKWQDYFARLNSLCDILQYEMDWEEKRNLIADFTKDISKPRRSKNNAGIAVEKEENIKECLEPIKDLVEELQFSERHWPVIVSSLQEFHGFAEIYMDQLIEKKLSEASLEPNDLEFFSQKLLNEKPEVVQKFATDFDAWFIDEFQDTSPLQLKILEAMIAKSPSYLVGDPQQSIYLFRGSRSEVFVQKEKSMEDSGAEIVNLAKNYRSQQYLLDFFNDFFPKMESSFTTMQSTILPVEDQSAVEITHNTSDDFQVEIQNMVVQIASLLDQGASLKDIGVLTRTRDQLDSVQKELMKRGYPVISHSSAGFYQRREILDALSLLKFLINPWDNKNLILLMRSPWMALDDTLIAEILKQKDNRGYWPLFRNFFQKNPNHGPGQALLKAVIDKLEYGVGWTLRKTLIQLGVVDYCFKIDSTGRREANLWKLINLVEKTSREPGANLLQLANDGYLSSSLEEFGDSSDASSPVEPNKIHLMTIHASKGLQFRHVFIPFLHRKPRDTVYQEFCHDEERRLWSLRLPLVNHGEFVGGVLEKLALRSLQEREAQEALRVFYVGMTRAEEKLFLSWSGKPEKRSWANHLVSYKETGPLPGYVQFNPIEDSQERLYVVSAKGESVRSGYQPEDKRPSTPAVTAADLTSDFADWDEWSRHQSRRWEGVVLHKVFESLKHHDRDKVFALAQNWLPTKRREITAAMNYVLENQMVPLQRIIQEGFVEWGYQHQVDDELIERRIDLWGIVDDTLWVVDYKTGSAKYKDKAFEQMRQYSAALIQYLDWQGPVKKVAVFPFDGVLFTD